MDCTQLTQKLQQIQAYCQQVDLALIKKQPVLFGIKAKIEIEDIIRIIEKNPVRLTEAKKIMGQDFFGPEEIKAAFGASLELNDIPPISFSRQELERAKGLGQILILRVGRLFDGSNLTFSTIVETLSEKFRDEGDIFLKTDWYRDEEFFTGDPIADRWALVSKGVVPDSIDKNYLEQTDALIAMLKHSFDFRSPENYLDAIQEYILAKDEIIAMMDSDWKKAAERLERLKINQMLRQTPAEVLYDSAIYYQNTGKRLLQNTFTMTNRRDSDGHIVDVGHTDIEGVRIGARWPVYSDSHHGVIFSRTC